MNVLLTSGSATAGFGKRPNMISKGTDSPRPLLFQRHCCRSSSPTMRAENVARGGRVEEHGASAPNDSAAGGSFRRKKKTLYGVPKAPRGADLRRRRRRRRGCRLRSNVRQDDLLRCRLRSNDRHDCTKDQIPVRIERDWNDWLYVERILRTIERPEATVIIALKRNANKAGDRVCQFLGKLLTALLCKSRRAATGCKNPERMAPESSPPPQATLPENQNSSMIPMVVICLSRLHSPERLSISAMK